MFKVKHKETGEIIQVLDAYPDTIFHKTYFLCWINGMWQWRSADKYVPPNVEIEKERS